MSITDLPIFDQIRGRLSWLGERQRVIAQNVANADTPGYGARDIAAPSDFAQALRMTSSGVSLARTSAAHIPAQSASAPRMANQAAPDSETTLDGNSVVVEEQMLKMAESRMAYDAAIGLYQKSLAMIRLAAKPPGR